MGEVLRDFKNGDWVYMKSLTGAVHLNGKLGQIVRYLAGKGRYEVFVPDLPENKFSEKNVTKLLDGVGPIDHAGFAKLFQDVNPKRALVKLVRSINLELYEKKDLVLCQMVLPQAGGGLGDCMDKWFPREHPMFRPSNFQGNSPVFERCEFPIYCCQYPCDRNANARAAYDNQFATYMKITMEEGLAPQAWQQYVGPVLVFRPQNGEAHQHISNVDIGILWDFANNILDKWGDGFWLPEVKQRVRDACSKNCLTNYVRNTCRSPGMLRRQNIVS